MTIDALGHIWTSGPFGFSTGQSLLWKSEDKGDSYDLLTIEGSPVGLRPCSTPAGPGGGDTDQLAFTAVDGRQVFMYADLEALAGILTCTSFDGGNTWPIVNPLAASQEAQGGADRMWLAHDVIAGKDVEYLYNNDLVSGGMGVYRSTDYGANWTVAALPAFTDTTPVGIHNAGAIVVDPATHYVYISNGDFRDVIVGVSKNATKLNRRMTFRTRVVTRFGADPFDADLVRMSLDRVGNVYLSWIDPVDFSVGYSFSTDQGETWARPLKVSGSQTTVFPAIVAGDPGRVALTWFGTRVKGNPTDNSGPWDIFFAQSTNALSPRPTFHVIKVTKHPAHTNPVCLAGIACTAPQGYNRNLADFISIAVDRDGAALIAYADTANNLYNPALTLGTSAGAPILRIARQVAGPSLYSSRGPLRLVPRVEGSVRDRRGDAYFLKHSSSGRGPNSSVQDIVSASITERKSRLRATIQLAKVSALANQSNVTYLLTWWFKNAIYYAKAQTGSDGLDCSTGTPVPITNQTGVGKIAIYEGGDAAPCYLDSASRTIRIDIPTASVGDPKRGDTLFEAAAYSFNYKVPGTLMDQVDATAPFNYRIP